jgi:monothiol glutaredoxin
MERPLLAADHRTAVVSEQIATFNKDFLDEVRAAVTAHPVVVVGMGQNPVVRGAKKALTAAGIPFHYVGHGSYLSGYRVRLAVKMWSGYPTFPQVFVKGVLIGGLRELKPMIASGELTANKLV